MQTLEIITIIILLAVLAEVTYMLTKLPRTSLKTKRRAVLVDTSVIMDGRIASVAKTGFIGDTLVIPRSVVGELQLLADNSDTDKRERARAGLDLVNELQMMPEVDVELLQDGSSAPEGVDNRLLSLAKQHHALICTIDYNLNKVATVEGIQVLNINDLAGGLRMAHLPGEKIDLEIVQKGQDSHQGVGYLADGTMVVVEQASAMIGKSVPIEIIRSLQTSAGKMMFAKRIQAHPIKQLKQPKAAPVKPVKEPALIERNESRQQPVSKPSASTPTVQQPRPQQNRHAQPQSQAQPRKNAQSRGRRAGSNEDSLIALVERQNQK